MKIRTFFVGRIEIEIFGKFKSGQKHNDASQQTAYREYVIDQFLSSLEQ